MIKLVQIYAVIILEIVRTIIQAINLTINADIITVIIQAPAVHPQARHAAIALLMDTTVVIMVIAVKIVHIVVQV